MSKIDDIKNFILLKFPHLEIYDVDDIYDMAKYNYLSIRYPFDKTIMDIPESDERDLNWIRDRMIDIVERSGSSSAKAYSENGLSISYSSAYITKNLGI